MRDSNVSGLCSINGRFLELLREQIPKYGSARKLSRRLQVSVSTLDRWLKSDGETARARLEQLVQLCQATNNWPDELGLIAPTSQQIAHVLSSRKWAPDPFSPSLVMRSDPAKSSANEDTPFPVVRRSSFRFRFVPVGDTAAPFTDPQDELWLDVGNRLQPGVIDHHQMTGNANSAARLVVEHPELMTGALRPDRSPEDPFTIVLQENVDLDCLASSYLAMRYLSSGTFGISPHALEIFVSYVDRNDQGFLGMSLEHKFTLYAAFYRLKERLLTESPSEEYARGEFVRVSTRLFDFVINAIETADVSLYEFDAFTCPGLFTEEDRRFMERDKLRYEQSLVDERHRARMGMLELPLRLGGRKRVEALFIRNVAGESGDLSRNFKIWARTDANRAPSCGGFVVLSMFHHHPVRTFCIVSIKPEVGSDPASDVTLRGLGERLEAAERRKRIETEGVDNRLFDANGNPRQNRTGCDHPDPWYDGRGHKYTIVDGPNGGTVLSPDEIEQILLEYGRSTDADFKPLW